MPQVCWYRLSIGLWVGDWKTLDSYWEMRSMSDFWAQVTINVMSNPVNTIVRTVFVSRLPTELNNWIAPITWNGMMRNHLCSCDGDNLTKCSRYNMKQPFQCISLGLNNWSAAQGLPVTGHGWQTCTGLRYDTCSAQWTLASEGEKSNICFLEALREFAHAPGVLIPAVNRPLSRRLENFG